MSPARTETLEAHELIDRAIELSVAEREIIALRLLDSIDPPPNTYESKEALRAELQRRIEDIESGKVKTYTIEETVRRYVAPRAPCEERPLCKQIAGLSRDAKEQLLIWLQEELDGGPFIVDLPEKPAEPGDAVNVAWKEELSSRIEEMHTGRVEAIEAQGSAARLLQKMLRKYGP